VKKKSSYEEGKACGGKRKTKCAARYAVEEGKQSPRKEKTKVKRRETYHIRRRKTTHHKVIFLALDDARYLVRDSLDAHLGLEIVCCDLQYYGSSVIMKSCSQCD
jgi:hypothetical protein